MVTVNSPIILPRLIAGYPGTVSDIQQMPYGIGTTFPELVDQISTWIPDQLIPYLISLNQSNDDVINVLNTALTDQTNSVMSQLATVLAQIIAGENVQLNDGSVLAALESLNSVTLAFLDDRANTRNAPVFSHYSPAPSGADDTAALAAWLTANTGKALTMLPGVYNISALTIPAGTTLFAYDAVFHITGATNGITLNADNSALVGAEVDGSAMTGTGNLLGIGILVSNCTNIIVRDCNVHDTTQNGISVDHGTNVTVRDNTVGTCRNNSNGIGATFSNDLFILENSLSSNYGIEVWGGNAATPGVGIGCTNVRVNGNSCKGGGIFLASCQDFSINDNYSINGPDVGVDAEGCISGTMSNNVIRDANNYGVSIFYGSNDVVISGNKVTCSATPTGLKNGIGIVTGVRASGITITGNNVFVAGQGIYTDQDSLGDSQITGNRIHGDGYGILLLESYEVIVESNRVSTKGARGIGLEGSYNCIVNGNRIVNIGGDGSALGSNGGIWLYDRGGNYHADGCHVANNKVSGFATSIRTNAGNNYIGRNGVDNLSYATGVPNINFDGNYSNQNPNNPVSATAN